MAQGLSCIVSIEVVSRPSFCLGEEIQGSLNINPLTAVAIVCISMELVCECQLEICESTTEMRITSSGNSSGVYWAPVVERHFFSYSMELLHTHPVNVFDARATGGAVFSSPVSIPFSVPLPLANLPSSLRSFRGKIHPFGVTYYLRINAFNPLGQLLNTIRHSVNVFSVFGFVGPEKPMLLQGNPKYKTFCCFPTKQFSVFCATDRTVYCPGEQIKISYWVEMDKAETISKITSLVVSLEMYSSSYSPPGVFLLQQRTMSGALQCGTGKPTPQTFHHLLASQDLELPNFGTVHCGAFTVPPDCGPACGATNWCPLSWNYKVTLRIKVDNVMEEELIVLPIALNGKNAEQLALINNTLIVACLPAGASEAQQLYASSGTNLASIFTPACSSKPLGGVSTVQNDDLNKCYVSVPVAEKV